MSVYAPTNGTGPEVVYSDLRTVVDNINSDDVLVTSMQELMPLVQTSVMHGSLFSWAAWCSWQDE